MKILNFFGVKYVVITHNAPYRRHRNPDGSEGGLVAETAYVDSSVTLSYQSLVCGKSMICGGAVLEGRTIVAGTTLIDGSIHFKNELILGGIYRLSP